MKKKWLVVALAVAAIASGTVIAQKRGYRFGAHTLVRCKQGHLFTTIWIPGISFKSIRLGWSRYQYCPVGKHWSLVKPIREADLTEDEIRSASEVHDVRIP